MADPLEHESRLYPVVHNGDRSSSNEVAIQMHTRYTLQEVQSLPPLAGDMLRPSDAQVAVRVATSSTATGAVLPAHVVRIIPDTWRGRMRERRTVLSMQCYNLCCKPLCGSNPYGCLIVSCWIFVGMCLGFLLAVFLYRCVRESVVNN